MDFDALLNQALVFISEHATLVLIGAIAVILVLMFAVLFTTGDPGTRKKADKKTMREIEKARQDMRDTRRY